MYKYYYSCNNIWALNGILLLVSTCMHQLNDNIKYIIQVKLCKRYKVDTRFIIKFKQLSKHYINI